MSARELVVKEMGYVLFPAMRRPDPENEDSLVPFLGAVRVHPDALLGSRDVINLHSYLIGYN